MIRTASLKLILVSSMLMALYNNCGPSFQPAQEPVSNNSHNSDGGPSPTPSPKPICPATDRLVDLPVDSSLLSTAADPIYTLTRVNNNVTRRIKRSVDGGANFQDFLFSTTNRYCDVTYSGGGELKAACFPDSGDMAAGVPQSPYQYFISENKGQSWKLLYSKPHSDLLLPGDINLSPYPYFHADSSGTYIPGQEFIRNTVAPLNPSGTYSYNEYFAVLVKVAPDGQVSVLDRYLPTGWLAGEYQTVLRASDGVIYAMGALSEIYNPNARLISNRRMVFVRRSLDDGQTWSTVFEYDTSYDSWDISRMVLAPNGSLAIAFAHSLSNGGSATLSEYMSVRVLAAGASAFSEIFWAADSYLFDQLLEYDGLGNLYLAGLNRNNIREMVVKVFLANGTTRNLVYSHGPNYSETNPNYIQPLPGGGIVISGGGNVTGSTQIDFWSKHVCL